MEFFSEACANDNRTKVWPKETDHGRWIYRKQWLERKERVNGGGRTTAWL